MGFARAAADTRHNNNVIKTSKSRRDVVAIMTLSLRCAPIERAAAGMAWTDVTNVAYSFDRVYYVHSESRRTLSFFKTCHAYG